jgi:hypothetical protein
MIWVLPFESMLRIRTHELMDDKGIQLAEPIGGWNRSDDPGHSLEHSAAKRFIIGNLKAIGYEVDPSQRINGSLVDFVLIKEGVISYALYRPTPSQAAINYLYGIGEKWTEKVFICDGIQTWAEELCAKLRMKYITTDLLEAKKPPFAPMPKSEQAVQPPVIDSSTHNTIQVQGSVSGGISIQSRYSINDLRQNLEALKSLLAEIPNADWRRYDVEAAQSAVKVLSNGLGNPENADARKRASDALEVVKRTQGFLGGFTDIGAKFSELMAQMEPMAVAIFRLFT